MRMTILLLLLLETNMIMVA